MNDSVKKSEVKITDVAKNGCISVLTASEEGNHREALTPLQFDRAREILPEDLFQEVAELWTDEVVQAYKDSLPKEAPPDLETLRRMKLTEVNTDCKQTIYQGVSVVLSGGEKHFSLTAEDQSNIDNLTNKLIAVQLGALPAATFAQGVPYHSDGADCVFYSPEDFMKLATAKDMLILYHTTYCNQLKQYIATLETAEELAAVAYGMTLPTEYQAKVDAIVGGVEVDA